MSLRPYRYGLLLLLVMTLGLALRLPHLSDRSLWYDEASSWQTAAPRAMLRS